MTRFVFEPCKSRVVSEYVYSGAAFQSRSFASTDLRMISSAVRDGGECMVRRSFASRFSKLEETVCANVSGLLVKQKLLATMKSAQDCPTKWVELKRPHFHTGFSHAGWDRSPIHRSV
jgi:hypothetical protein